MQIRNRNPMIKEDSTSGARHTISMRYHIKHTKMNLKQRFHHQHYSRIQKNYQQTMYKLRPQDIE